MDKVQKAIEISDAKIQFISLVDKAAKSICGAARRYGGMRSMCRSCRQHRHLREMGCGKK